MIPCECRIWDNYEKEWLFSSTMPNLLAAPPNVGDTVRDMEDQTKTFTISRIIHCQDRGTPDAYLVLLLN